jgi:hypothetical protein
LIDLLVIDKDYLNEDNYRVKEVSGTTFVKTTIDQQILSDSSIHFRVFNDGNEKFSQQDYRVSVFHKAIGGYHPAKLRIYNDVITRYLYGGDPTQVLNMLNTKYIIRSNPQAGQSLQLNPSAYGAAWLVKGIKVVKDDVEELQALGVTNLKDTAVVQQSLADKTGKPQWDSAASITITKFDNDRIEYSSNAAGPQFAVFSEIYYPYGWNAYIDDKKAEYIRTNYTLRGLVIPGGKHTIKFVFEPSSYKKGTTLTYIASWLIVLFVLGGFFMAWWQQRKKEKV